MASVLIYGPLAERLKSEIIGQEWGSSAKSHLGKTFLILQPALDDILRDIKRNTQIMYPKDIGYVIVTMGIGPGKHVLEAGTGSGALTIAMAHAVGPTGHITSYEKRANTKAMAENNLRRLGLLERVTLKERDIEEGFDETDVYAVFLDVQNPEDYIPHVRAALMPGGFFGALLPTTNQITRLIYALEANQFSFIEVSEMLHRYYKPIPQRLRPADKMVAHTGFLIFARAIAAPVGGPKELPPTETTEKTEE